MELHITSPEKTEIFTVEWIEAFTPTGSFIIQAGHAPTVLMLSPGKKLIFGLKNKSEQSITIPHGILEVMRTKVVALINKPI
jgi:F0F1-type ATP synthase epsilon subunit